MSRLRWRCRRGTKELDIVMNKYLNDIYPTASADEQSSFDALLSVEDPLIFDMLMDKRVSEDADQQALIEILKRIMTE